MFLQNLRFVRTELPNRYLNLELTNDLGTAKIRVFTQPASFG